MSEQELEFIGKMSYELASYKLIFGEVKDPYGKVDTRLAFKTYKENESFHQNFARYMEQLKTKLESD